MQPEEMQNTLFHLVSVQWWSVIFEELSQDKMGGLVSQTSCCSHWFHMLARRKIAERDFAQVRLRELPPRCAHHDCSLHQCWAGSGVHSSEGDAVGPVLQTVHMSVSVTSFKIEGASSMATFNVWLPFWCVTRRYTVAVCFTGHTFSLNSTGGSC